MSLFDIPKLEKDVINLEKQTLDENFWNDTKNSTKILSKIKQIKSKCTEFKKIQEEIKEQRGCPIDSKGQCAISSKCKGRNHKKDNAKIGWEY